MDSFDQRIKLDRKLLNKHKKDDLIKTTFYDCHQKFCIKNFQSSRLIRLTCKGNLHDKNFPSKLKNILSKLSIILSNGKNLIKVTKVEPWNSVRVTLNLSDDAAQQLRHLAEHGDENLREIGILSVQLDGQQVISLNLPNSNVTTTNIHQHNNERRSIQNNNNNDDDDDNQNNNNNDKIGEDFDGGNSPKQIKETESLDHHQAKYQFDRINGAAIDDNSDSCSITNTNTSTSFEPGGLSSMMVVMNDDDSKNNNVPGNPPPPTNSSFSNQKSVVESTSATISMDCTDDVSHHFGSHQQHKLSSLNNTFVKNEPLINYVANNNSSNDNCNNNNNSNNNNQNTSDIQNSWHSPATIKDQTESTINPCLSNLRISCQSSSVASTDTITEQKFQTNPSSSNTMASNMIRTNTEPNMQSQSTSNALSSQKSVPNVVSSFKMHQTQTIIKQESLSDSLVVSESNADNNADNLRNDSQLINQIKSSNHSYQQPSQQQGPSQQQQQQQNQVQANAATNNSSSDILGSSIDAVDDDLLNSVVTAGGADPNDFTDSDLSWLEIANPTNNSNRTSTTTLTTTAVSASGNAVSNKSSISIQMNASNLVATSTATNVARIQQQESKTTSNLMSVPMSSLPYFLHQQKPSQQQQQQFSTKIVNTLPTNVMGSNQSILINSTNPNQSTVLTSLATSSTNNNNNNNNTNNLNQSNASISTGTSTTTIFPFTSLQNSGIRLQQQPPMSSSPRHIYVPARTQQSWPTANSGSPQQSSNTQQTPPSTPPMVANQKRYNQQQPQQATTSTSDGNITQSSAQQQQQQQQPPTRFLTINSNGSGSLVRPQLSLAQQINNNNGNQNKPQQQQMNQSQQIVIRSSGNSGAGGGGGSFSNNQQQSSPSTQQNAVALSSPLLVNLLQSDVTSPFQQPLLNNAGGNSSHSQQQQQQQQQFLNQSGTRQIRFITHGSNDHSEGSTPLMMMVQVSSSGHQSTQIVSPVTANMVSVAKTPVVASSNVQQQQQRSIEQSNIMATTGGSNNNDSNNGGSMVVANKPAKKPRKPRKSKNQTENRMADSSVQTSGSNDCLNNASHTTTPTNFVTMTNIGSIPITSNTDMSARIQTSSVSTFITVPTSSMAQSIVKLQQQPANNGGNLQQSILSSPNSGGQGGGHAIFNPKSRVQPVVMIAANSASMDAANSCAASQAPTIVSSAGGTFILANMNSLNVNSSSAITSTASTSGVQLSGARKQIFLATKSNSFPVSSALSAGAIVARFANNPSSSTPTLVSSPVKLVSQQQQQQQSSNNSLTMSPNELRNMSAPATPQPQQQQQQASLLSTPIKSSPSPVMASPIQTSSLPINANMIPNSPSSLSSSSTSSTSSQATNNSNLFANSSSSSSSSNNMLQTLNTVVSMASSPMKTAKSSNNSEQYLLAPSPSSNSSNSQQQQSQSNNSQFKNFQIPKATPTSLLLNKLNQANQQQQQQILAAISTGNMSSNTCGKIAQFKPVPHVVSNVQKQFLAHSGGNNDDHNNANNQVTMENSFVVKQIKTSLAGSTVASQVPNLVDNNDRLHQQKNRETFVQVNTGQHNTKIVSQNLQPISNFKQSLADMLANTGENSASNDKIVTEFLENDPEKISEPAAPISPSYFLAPASAFDIQTKCVEQKATEIKNEELGGQQDGLLEPKTMDTVEPQEAKDTSDTSNKSNITSKTFSLTAIVTSCAGTVTTATLSPLITATGLESTPFTSRTDNITATSSKKNYDSFDVSQDLPDNILDDDDDEEDGSDSDDDEFCFFPKRKSHFLSGSIGSIGGSGGGNSNSNTPKKSEPNQESSISGGSGQKSYQPTKDTKEPMLQTSSSLVTALNSNEETVRKDEKPISVKNETLKTEDGSIQSNLMTNGDLSQDSSNTDEDSKQGIKQSSSLPPLLPPTSCQMPIITPIIAKSETITKMTLDISSSETSTMAMLKEPAKVTTAAKNRRISPPTGGSAKSAAKPARRKTLSSLEKSVSVPTTPTKTVQPMFIGSTSTETTAEKRSTLLHNEINNESPNKKSLFILKHPQAISTTGAIQISNPNQTLAQYLQADGSTISANSTASIIASSSSSSSSSTTTPSSSPTPSTVAANATNQKLKLVCFGTNKYLSIQPNSSVQGAISDSNSSGVLYRVPGAGKQFVVLKQMMVNESGNTIKLISNKLPTSVAGQGTSQSVFIPMVPSTASNNNNTLLSVKPNTANTTNVAAQIVTSNDVLMGVHNSQTNVMEATSDTKLVAKKMNVVRSGSLPNVPLAPGLNEKLIKNMDNEMFNMDANNRNTSVGETGNRNVQTPQLFDSKSVSSMDSNKESLPEITSSKIQEEKAEGTSSFTTIQVDRTSQEDLKKQEINQNDPKNASVKAKEATNVTSVPIQRTVHIMSRSSNDLAAAAAATASSNLMILKTDGSRIPTTTAATTENKDLAGIGRSNSPNAGLRRPILITKSVPYNPLNISQTIPQQVPDGSSTSVAIYATKSNNPTITATKTLPTILRQSKRKNDYVHPSTSSATPQTISVTMEQSPATIKTIFDGSGGNDSFEAESESTFRPQQQPKFQTFSSNDDESISDPSMDSSTPRPKKRARKSKVTPLPQALIGDAGRVFLNVDPISLDQESASQGDSSEPEAPGNSRVLRNSITLPSFSKPKATPKRVQRNATKTQSPNTVRFIHNESIQTFLAATTTTTPNETMLVKPNDKTKKVRKANTTTPRPTRSRAKKQPEPSAMDHQMIDTNPAETFASSSTSSSSTSSSSSSDAVAEIHQSPSMPNQTGGNLMANKNMVLPTIITTDGSLVARPVTAAAAANCVRTNTMSSFVPTQQINVLSVSNTSGSGVTGGEHYVSLLDSSSITTNSPNNGNNSLLVKRPRKSLQPASTIRPSLRNIVSPETISGTATTAATAGTAAATSAAAPSTPSPNKRRRLAKDIAK